MCASSTHSRTFGWGHPLALKTRFQYVGDWTQARSVLSSATPPTAKDLPLSTQKQVQVFGVLLFLSRFCVACVSFASHAAISWIGHGGWLTLAYTFSYPVSKDLSREWVEWVQDGIRLEGKGIHVCPRCITLSFEVLDEIHEEKLAQERGISFSLRIDCKFLFFTPSELPG